MARATAPAARHLTDETLAERWGLSVQAVRVRRRSGDVPRYLLLTEGATKQTIRYPLAEVEKYEAEHLIDPAARVTA